MPKNKRGKKIKPGIKAAKTKKQIERVFEKYNERMRKNGIRWNRQTASKIVKLSKREKTSFKNQIENKIKKSFSSKTYYVKRKYGADIQDAREIVRDRIINKIPYSENPIIKAEKEIEDFLEDIKPMTGLIAFVDLKNESDKPDIEFVIFEGTKYTKEKFTENIPSFRQRLKDLCTELNINFDYARISFVYKIEIRNNILIINLLPSSQIKNIVTDTERANQ